jgi:hypothetical protein
MAPFFNGLQMALATHILWLECGVSNPSIDDELCKRSYICIGIRIIAAVYANSFVRAREEHSTNVEN